MHAKMQNFPITKKILHPGRAPAPELVKGAKVCFHFQTRIASNDDSHNGEIVDDSRKFGQPFELLIGKEFKLEVWESAVRMMGIGEVAIFSVEPNLVSSYPFVSKTLRDMYNKTSANKSNHHCCGMLMTDNATIGYEDLDQLLKEPKQLEFTIELLSVELPGDYNKEIWQMEPDEKLSNLSKIKESGNELYKNKEYELEKLLSVELPGDYNKEIWQMEPDEKLSNLSKIKESGNELYKNKEYELAAEQYSMALGTLEQLMLREKPEELEWKELDRKQIPFFMNYAQCKIQMKQYYEAIEQLDKVLKRDPGNVKALFRRGQCHSQVWDIERAKKDFYMAIENDKTLRAAVEKEINEMERRVKEFNMSEKRQLKNMFS
ncbi:AH receptor-interacting protein-like [Artemia franciscana]|uniref:AH receptor-interacting protein-like n=1 Tax=Artemia franciscana TaxID=6661 RepID=UPI0032DAF623